MLENMGFEDYSMNELGNYNFLEMIRLSLCKYDSIKLIIRSCRWDSDCFAKSLPIYNFWN